VGGDLIGQSTAVRLDVVLWVLGTIYGLATTVAVPYWAFTRHDVPRTGPSAAG
jgi:hypothetical protein